MCDLFFGMLGFSDGRLTMLRVLLSQLNALKEVWLMQHCLEGTPLNN